MSGARSTFKRFLYVYVLFLVAGAADIGRIIAVQSCRDRVTSEDNYK